MYVKHVLPLALAFLPFTAALTTPLPQDQSPLTRYKTPSSLPSWAHEELLLLHRKIVEIPSITYTEFDVGVWLSWYLRSHGWSVTLQDVSRGSETGSARRYNVLSWPGGSDAAISGEERVLLSSHIDVVPPYWPYWYDEKKQMVGGRGSVDAKGSVASQIIALLHLLREGGPKIRNIILSSVSLVYVVGEETGGDGMRFYNVSTQHERSNFTTGIFGEPTEGKLVSGHKGNLGMRLVATGKAAHSGYPWLGCSANDILIEALAKLKAMEKSNMLPSSKKYGKTTVNIGRMEGGVAANVVAESANATIAMRLAGSDPKHVRGLIMETLKGTIESAKEQGGKLGIEWASEGYGPVDMECDVKGFECLTVNYGTDVPNLSGGHKRYLYGPGNIFVAHSDHEALKVRDLEEAVLGYEKLLLHALGVKGEEDDDVLEL